MQWSMRAPHWNVVSFSLVVLMSLGGLLCSIKPKSDLNPDLESQTLLFSRARGALRTDCTQGSSLSSELK